MEDNRITVASITEAYKNELVGRQMPNGMYYNPIQLPNELWIVSMIEAQYIPAENLTLVDYYPTTDENLEDYNAKQN